MGQWEPLADRIPLDMRRLATQLRRMKDRSGLTVPALAARTAEPAEAWAAYLAAGKVPPQAAVEVLAQASGADYDRIGALRKLAAKAAEGSGDRGRGKPVPQPDPLDPLSAQDGLPARRRRLVAAAGAGVLAVAALLAIVLMTGTSNGREPGRDADRTGSGVTPGTSAPPAPARSRTPMQAGRTPDPGTSGSTAPSGAAAPPQSATGGSPLPSVAATTSAPPGAPATTPPGTAPSAPSSPASPTSGGTPSPTHTGLCLGLIVLGICVG